MTKYTNLTVKGQMTIPKDVRDALGLKPGEPVEIDWQGGTEAVIRRGMRSEAEHARQVEAMRGRLRMVAEKYKHLRTGQSSDAYMAEIREPLP